MDTCINHPDHAAIERCEVCSDPLCDLCLWYAEDGRRLCEEHAREHEQAGGEVQSPDLYEGGIRVREAEPAVDTAPFRGNDNDLIAAIAAMFGLTSLMNIFGLALCMPILALVMGIVTLTSRSKSIDPGRTRTLGILGIVLAAASFLPFILFFCMFFFAMTFPFMLTLFAGPQGP
jgi:uncharacterized membrane protein